MKQKSPYGAVPRNLVGDNGPSVNPGDDPTIYGAARLEPAGPVEARSYQTYRLSYTVGKLGLDDTGAIRVAWRMVSDSGIPQMTNPQAANYVTASSNGEGSLELNFDKFGGQRPWNQILNVRQRGGYLMEGDEIVIVFGDTAHGSPGMLAQTFVEGGREFRVLADVQATGNFVELPDTQLSLELAQIGFDDTVLSVGGLDRKLKVFRLPSAPLKREISFTRTIELSPDGDNPIWICVNTEDGPGVV